MLGNLSGPTLFAILFIVLLLFGAPKLPALAKSLGQSMKILKKEVAANDTTEPQRSDAATGTANANAAAGTAASVEKTQGDQGVQASAERASDHAD